MGRPDTDSGAPLSRCTLSKRQRLTRSSDIREAYAQGEKSVGRFMVMWIRRGPEAARRIAAVASRKSVGGAVKRNRARRRLKEVFRLNQHILSEDNDVVLVARSTLLEATWPDVQHDFISISEKAGILISNE